MEDIFFLTIGPFHPKLYGFYNSASKEVCHRTPEMFFRSCAGSPVASHSSSWHLTNIPAMFVGCGLCAVGVVRSASPVLLLVVHVCDPPHIPHRLTVSGKRGSHCRALRGDPIAERWLSLKHFTGVLGGLPTVPTDLLSGAIYFFPVPQVSVKNKNMSFPINATQ